MFIKQTPDYRSTDISDGELDLETAKWNDMTDIFPRALKLSFFVKNYAFGFPVERFVIVSRLDGRAMEGMANGEAQMMDKDTSKITQQWIR